ncbi:hypothetical protein [Streptomyces coeruleorubidus]
MGDRAQAERLRQTFALYFGEVKGDPIWAGRASTRAPGGPASTVSFACR